MLLLLVQKEHMSVRGEYKWKEMFLPTCRASPTLPSINPEELWNKSIHTKKT